MRQFLFACMLPCLAALPVLAEPPPAALHFPPAPGERIASYPRVTGNDPAVLRVNARLAELEQANLTSLLPPCKGGVRDVTVTHFSADALSLIASQGAYCEGAAHPWFHDRYLTFDLKTGTEVDWGDLLPFASKAGPIRSQNGLRSPALFTLYQGALALPMDAFCADAVNADTVFEVWLDARKPALGIMPTGLAYIHTPCLNPAFVPLDESLEAGAAPRLNAILSAPQLPLPTAAPSP